MNKAKLNEHEIRYNIMLIIVYIIGVILLVQLFNLQIINGEKYRKESNTRLTRETTLEAARGEILDRTGNKLVTTTMNFSIEIYKTKVDNEILNNTLLKLANLLEQDNDTYIDNFPISIEPYEFKIQESEQKTFKKSNNIDEEYSAEQCFEFFKNKYDIKETDVQNIRKIIVMRYEIARNGYSNTKAVQLAKNVSRNSILKISEENSEFPGIDIVTKPSVEYPSGTLASHILGTVGKITESELKDKQDSYGYNDIIGKTGIEYVYEDYLKGKNGTRQIDMSVNGTATDEYISKEATAGSNVVLTIDANLQKVTEQALKSNIEKIKNGGFSEKSNADAGAVAVMNVNTGEVLALASYPDYEPQLFAEGISTEKYNEYTNSNLKPLFNRAISGAYAPGSTFKMVTAIAGLESNKITPSEKINDTGVYPRGYNPVCWYWSSYHRGHGYLNVSEAIKHSCNYFFYETGYRIGIDTLSKYASYFVLGTPIQMAKYISMLVNGGNPVDVSIVKSIINSDGTEVSKQEIQEAANKKLNISSEKTENLNMKKENINAVLEGMKGVTSESGGTAYSTFRNFNIEVGGKTGSAQAGNKTNAWFVGFAPFDNPEIAVVDIQQKLQETFLQNILE